MINNTMNHNETSFTPQKMKQAYSNMAFQTKPTVLLTITVKEPKLRSRNDNGRWLVSDAQFLKKANDLMHWVNVELFGRKYKKNNKGLTGFGSIEKQASNQPHLHLAIDTKMPPMRFIALKRVFIEKCEKINLFNSNGIDLSLIGGSEADYFQVGAYVAKGGDMLFLSGDGIM